MVVIALGLSIVVIADAIDKDHQHGPCNEEQCHSRQRVHKYTDPEPGIPQRKPIDRRFKWVFAQMRHTQCAYKYDHAPKPGKECRTNSHSMTQRFALIREQHD